MEEPWLREQKEQEKYQYFLNEKPSPFQAGQHGVRQGVYPPHPLQIWFTFLNAGFLRIFMISLKFLPALSLGPATKS